MHNVTIIITDNGWWLPGGFVAILIFFAAPAVQAWKVRRSPPTVLFLLAGVIFGIFMLDYYAREAFGTFLKLEKKDSVVRFYYYFGRPREYPWQDVQRIVVEGGGKGGYHILFFMKDGTELRSYDTINQYTITAALSLTNQISQGNAPLDADRQPGQK